MNKKLLLGVLIVLTLLVGIAASETVYADMTNFQDPFQEIWKHIKQLTSQVENLETKVQNLSDKKFETYMLGSTHHVPDGSAGPLVLSCRDGDTLVSGGYKISSGLTNEPILGSFPITSGWQVDVFNTSGTDIDVDLFVVCHNNKS